jgi:hypothetical protein
MENAKLPISDQKIQNNAASVHGQIIHDLPDFLTPAQKNGWKPAHEWATSRGVWQDLVHLINVTLLWDLPDGFGILIEYLISPLWLDLLQKWSQQREQPAIRLKRISDALINDSSTLITAYPSIHKSSLASQQLRGKIRQKYLLGMLLENDPFLMPNGEKVTEAQNDWLGALKLWLLVHALYRETSRNIADRLLQQGCDHLRLALSGDRNLKPERFVAILQNAMKYDDFTHLGFPQFHGHAVKPA